MDKLDAMQTFVRVAEAGSFIAVANQLQVARSVVTRQIAALEKHLGTKLITRSTRSLALTAAGSAYLEKCRVILNMVDAAESSLAEEKTVPRGRIRLGLPLSYGLQELMPALLDFARDQPFIELIMDLSDQRANLIEEGLDLSIRITAELQPGDIVRKLGECQLLTLASPGYLAQHGEPRHPSELRHHDCLIYASDSATTQWAYREGAQGLQVPVRGRIVANNGSALTEAAARGMGITRQPDFIAAPYLAQGRIKSVLQDFEIAPLGIYAVLPSNRYIPHRVSALIEHLAQALQVP
ncbi:LysR family transcriptional regulator [Limnohabitans radicicola]|uniref:LysR family transcriptional regulator n=1 Tax=Limnohabitans radicicola TaxID=2771427 RepID=A0A927IL24_9BURK|nr:LysR family transcriptional regulator [Limnohabitans radicicola]MBD8050273.1 LysR family transcriptional regulator [Limnohabitans radicicola]